MKKYTEYVESTNEGIIGTLSKLGSWLATKAKATVAQITTSYQQNIQQNGIEETLRLGLLALANDAKSAIKAIKVDKTTQIPTVQQEISNIMSGFQTNVNNVLTQLATKIPTTTGATHEKYIQKYGRFGELILEDFGSVGTGLANIENAFNEIGKNIATNIGKAAAYYKNAKDANGFKDLALKNVDIILNTSMAEIKKNKIILDAITAINKSYGAAKGAGSTEAAAVPKTAEGTSIKVKYFKVQKPVDGTQVKLKTPKGDVVSGTVVNKDNKLYITIELTDEQDVILVGTPPTAGTQTTA